MLKELDDEYSNQMPNLKSSKDSDLYDNVSVEKYIKMLKELDDEYSNQMPNLKASKDSDF
jgi:hypothetical protein